MKTAPILPVWTLAAPAVAWLLFAGTQYGLGGAFLLLVAAGLIVSVLAAVHHAEVVAHRVGEPLGTLVLAVAITVIEVALIVSLMLGGGAGARALARRTRWSASSSPASCFFPRDSPRCAPRAPIACRRASTWRWARRSPASA